MTMDRPELLKIFNAKMAASGLEKAVYTRLKFTPMTVPEVAKLDLKFNVPGFILPYFDLAGKPTKFFRFRYLDSTLTGFKRAAAAKETRYVQPPGSAPELYIPPLMNWPAYLAKKENPLVFTEGELKAACATHQGLPTLGLGGVWSFRSAKQAQALLPIFARLQLKERKVVICYDSDAATNPNIRRAEYFFANELSTLGAVVYIARMPPLDGHAKTGLDDYIVARGVQDLNATVIGPAQAFAMNRELHHLNTEVTVVLNPGFICRLTDRLAMSWRDFTALQYSTLTHEVATASGGVKHVSTAAEWLKWPGRSEVSSMTYAPDAEEITAEGQLNAWRGWGVVPARGPVKLWAGLLDYVFGPKVGARTWFERWCAYPLQHPGAKMRNAAVLWGALTGTGKSLIGYTLGRIYGENFVEIGDNALDPDKDFNSWARNRQFVLADDITGNSSRKLANKLKVMITRERVEINEKHVRQFFVPDCINYLFTSNDSDAFYLDKNDRRFFVHHVETKAPAAFFKEYDTWYKTDAGAGALFHHLKNLDLGDFDPMAEPPLTADKIAMMEASQTDLESWVAGLLSSPDDYLKGLKGDLFTADEVRMLYDPTGSKREVSLPLIARKLVNAGAVRVVPTDVESGQFRSRALNKLVKVFALRNQGTWRRVVVDRAREHFDSYRKNGPQAPGRKY